MTDWPTIDAKWPYCGPCAFCGCADKRHRLFDAMRGRVRAGESRKSVAEDYGCSMDALLAVLAPKRCPLRRKVRA
jgi:hypothetical protein